MQPGNFRKRKVLGTLGFPFCFPENLVSPKLTENGAYLRAGKRLNADVGWLEKSAAPARARSARGASLLGTWAGRVHTPRRARALAALARAGVTTLDTRSTPSTPSTPGLDTSTPGLRVLFEVSICAKMCVRER